MAEGLSGCDSSMGIVVEHSGEEVEAIEVKFALQDCVQVLPFIVLRKEVAFRAVLERIVLQPTQEKVRKRSMSSIAGEGEEEES